MSIVQDKVAIVTGGSRGIGKAIVEGLVAAGASVAFSYRSSSEASEALVEGLKKKYSSRVVAYRSDASDFAAAEEFVQRVLQDFGTVDVLVNNAGITQDNLLLRMSEDQWQNVLDVNLKSVFNLTKQVLRPMMKKRSGSIINISSIVGVIGNAGQSNYAASKAGIIGFSKSIAKELGSRNIRCNVIAPGYIETEMTDGLPDDVKAKFMQNIPLRRMGTGADVANAVLFLASDQSAYISGQVLSVCGGLNI